MSNSETKTLAQLQERLAYTFSDESLLREAITHASYTRSHPDCPHFQRLEFLGDSILNLIVSEALFGLHPEAREGELTRMRSHLTCGKNLFRLAQKLQLSQYIIIDDSQQDNRVNHKKSVQEDVMEAIIGAVYLDGGKAATHELLSRLFDEFAVDQARADHNPKSQLQEYIQAQYGNDAIKYRTESSEGPSHRRSFTVSVYIKGKKKGTGTGNSLKNAQAHAARYALKRLAEEETQKVASSK